MQQRTREEMGDHQIDPADSGSHLPLLDHSGSARSSSINTKSHLNSRSESIQLQKSLCSASWIGSSWIVDRSIYREWREARAPCCCALPSSCWRSGMAARRRGSRGSSPWGSTSCGGASSPWSSPTGAPPSSPSGSPTRTASERLHCSCSIFLPSSPISI